MADHIATNREPSESSTPASGIDLPTLYAIAAVCYLAAILVHEGVGHAGTALLLGGEVHQITSTACQCDVSRVSPWAARAVFAGGCLANVLTALLALAALRLVSRRQPAVRYALWLFGHVSLLMATGYLMVFPFLAAGDWHDFVLGLQPAIAWKSGLTVLGAVGYGATIRHARRTLEAFVGTDPANRSARARTLTLVPYLVGGTIETLSALIGGGGLLVLISAIPATFGGTIGLPFAGRRVGNADGVGTSTPRGIPRSWLALALGAIAVAVHLFWLGPGLL
jgi:hypothetical protein